jgi:centromere/kinetochore protein ZW10
MASASTQADLGKILVDFSLNGTFPEEEAVSAASVEPSALSGALVVLQNAKADLEVSYKHSSLVIGKRSMQSAIFLLI